MLYASSVVGLHVLNHKVVGRTTLQSLLNNGEPLLALATINAIHYGNLLISDEVRVV